MCPPHPECKIQLLRRQERDLLCSAPFNREKVDMGRGDYSWVPGGQLKSGMVVLDIRGNAKKGSRLGSVPTGFGVEEEITKLRPAYPSQGREAVELHLKEVKNGAERRKFLSRAKLVQAKYKA
jgi:hypothetical protein